MSSTHMLLLHPAMRETHSATLARPDVTTSIGDAVAVGGAEIIHDQFLYPSCKGLNANLTNVDGNIRVIAIIICLSNRKVLDVRIFFGSNTCRARHKVWEQ